MTVKIGGTASSHKSSKHMVRNGNALWCEVLAVNKGAASTDTPHRIQPNWFFNPAYLLFQNPKSKSFHLTKQRVFTT
jgi:hypothetical protein